MTAADRSLRRGLEARGRRPPSLATEPSPRPHPLGKAWVQVRLQDGGGWTVLACEGPFPGFLRVRPGQAPLQGPVCTLPVCTGLACGGSVFIKVKMWHRPSSEPLAGPQGPQPHPPDTWHPSRSGLPVSSKPRGHTPHRKTLPLCTQPAPSSVSPCSWALGL